MAPLSAFAISLPGQILFGRGEAAKAVPFLAALGSRGVLVHGASADRAAWLVRDLRAAGLGLVTLACPEEPSLATLNAAVATARAAGVDWVAGLGGGAALDLAKALAALVPAPGGVMDHLEVVGKGLPLHAAPLPFVAIPTTAGTGAEVTRNAVISVPDQIHPEADPTHADHPDPTHVDPAQPASPPPGRKVSLRDPRMLARLAIIDPALTDHCPRAVTLASGLDALAQVIEPYVSNRATPFTDALTAPVIGPGLGALARLMQAEDPAARDQMAWVSLCGGLALANGGLGAVHGLAGPLGGVTGAAHGAICGALLGPVLVANAAAAKPGSTAAIRLAQVFGMIAAALGGAPENAPETLADWARGSGLPGLTALGLAPGQRAAVAAAAQGSSSMKGNPVPLSVAALEAILAAAS